MSSTRVDKQRIIDEIRRQAHENGGKPPGRLTFLKVSGFRRADWERYWLRWSDAVQEAGFQPNRPTGKITDGQLLSKLAELARDVGHFPLTAEIRMKARNDPTFPGCTTYSRRALKPHLARLLIDWCVKEGGWDDVRDLCAPVAYAEINKPAPPSPIAPGSRPGAVYLMRSGRYCKLGLSRSTETRRRTLNALLPEPITVIHEILTDDPEGIEKYWRHRFAHRRINGEWFNLTRDDIAAFRSRKSM